MFELWWSKSSYWSFMKIFVVHIDWFQRWNGCCIELVCIRLLWWSIIFTTTKFVKSANILAIFSLYLRYVLSYHQIMAFSLLGLNFIGRIHSPSLKGHHLILVCIYCFTTKIEAIPSKNMTRKEVVEFISEHIISKSTPLKH